ncbi:MAG TPA: DUF1616 domain-containing protein [Candidatus Dormibacteraeota bacterium]|nr:DUF1616 domain-containing protein [Candidatus Dormibacteraeota bacterium]
MSRRVDDVGSFTSYLSDLSSAWWFYAILLMSVLEVMFVAYPDQTAALLVLRILIGLGVLGYFPGYSTSRILFPGEQLSDLERILLSVFLSVTVSIVIGVILGIGYGFTGIASVVASTVYTGFSTILGAYRRYSFLRESTSMTRRES